MKPGMKIALMLAGALLLAACTQPPDDAAVVPAEPEVAVKPSAGVFASATVDAGVAGKWARSCALCHVDGTGGAPRAGMQPEWAQRVEQGEEALLLHTVEGFNNMPPLGYCMSCEEADLKALIKMMAGGGA